MSNTQHFALSLIGLRSHYQALNQEYERELAYLKEQLTHINALLVDRVVENQQFLESLIEMRSHYVSLNEQCRQKASHAQEQLQNVNALLADQFVLQHNEQQPVSIQATVKENPALKEAVDVDSQKLPKQVEEEPDYDFSPEREADKEDELKQTNQLTNLALPVRETPPLHDGASSDDFVVLTEPNTQKSSSFNKSDKPKSQSATTLKTPLLAKYQHLSKLQAIAKLLQEKQGRILHVDFIIRALYGELEPDAAKAEKSRIHDSLSTGVERGLWNKVPDQPGCYTLDLKMVKSESDQKQMVKDKHQEKQSRGKSSFEVLSRYQHLNFTEAVETIVRENSGQILTTDKVARELYGEISGQDLTKAKEKVGKTFWSGVKQKRWQRVPNQIGCYTLDLKLLN